MTVSNHENTIIIGEIVSVEIKIQKIPLDMSKGIPPLDICKCPLDICKSYQGCLDAGRKRFQGTDDEIVHQERQRRGKLGMLTAGINSGFEGSDDQIRKQTITMMRAPFRGLTGITAPLSLCLVEIPSVSVLFCHATVLCVVFLAQLARKGVTLVLILSEEARGYKTSLNINAPKPDKINRVASQFLWRAAAPATQDENV